MLLDKNVIEIDEIEEYLETGDNESAYHTFSSLIHNNEINETEIAHLYDKYFKNISDKHIYTEVTFGLALYFERQGNKKISKVYFFDLLNYLETSDTEGDRTLLARTYFHLGMYVKAVAVFESLNTLTYSTVQFLGDAYLKLNRSDDALNAYIMFLDENSEKYQFDENLNDKIAHIYLTRGDYDLAEQYYIRANVRERFHLICELALFYEEKHEYDLALKQYYRLLNLGEVLIQDKIDEVEETLSNEKDK